LSSKHDPIDCLEHVVENAGWIASYINGMSREQFADNRLVRDAVERCVERICEAAHRLGDRAQALMPNQPWADIRGMGNQLRHGYDRLDIRIIWAVASERVPA
jgi:uncharacterized protein with HEPN domain